MRTLRKQNKVLFSFLSTLVAVCFLAQGTAFAAGRSGAGGGKMASFNVGKWAIGTAVGVASSIGGSYASSAISGKPFSFDAAFDKWGDNFVSNLANNQMSRAVGSMGAYYGWNPKATILVGSVLKSTVMTGIDADSMSAAGIGAIKGFASGAVMAAMANKKGQVSPVAGFLGGMAGNMVGGLAATGGDMDAAMSNMVKSIPGGLISMGIGYATQKMKREDAYIVEQASLGLYEIADAGMAPAFKDMDKALKISESSLQALAKYGQGGGYDKSNLYSNINYGSQGNINNQSYSPTWQKKW